MRHYVVLDSRSVERKSKRTNPRSRILPRLRLRGGGVMYSRRGGDLAERCPRTRTDKRPSDGQTLAVAIGYFHIIYTSLHVCAAPSAFSAHAAAAVSIHCTDRDL